MWLKNCLTLNRVVAPRRGFVHCFRSRMSRCYRSQSPVFCFLPLKGCLFASWYVLFIAKRLPDGRMCLRMCWKMLGCDREMSFERLHFNFRRIACLFLGILWFCGIYNEQYNVDFVTWRYYHVLLTICDHLIWCVLSWLTEWLATFLTLVYTNKYLTI